MSALRKESQQSVGLSSADPPSVDLATIVACDIPVDENVAAILTNRSVSWLQKARHSGEGPPFMKKGKNKRARVSYLPSSIKAWAASLQTSSTSAGR